jgi:hypothetical protein
MDAVTEQREGRFYPSFLLCLAARAIREVTVLWGRCYVFVAIERHSKLVLNIACGKRDQATTDVFIEGLRIPAKEIAHSDLMSIKIEAWSRWTVIC